MLHQNIQHLLLQFVETTNTLLLVQPEQHILQMDVDNGEWPTFFWLWESHGGVELRIAEDPHYHLRSAGFDDQDDERDTISSAPGLQTQVQQVSNSGM